jgi:ATPase subunit of ABC transporter with duplicated ATPase domains
MPQFIYTIKGLGKVHPPDIKVLDDIWLSFYFGAKIGVLGLNGAGKSSLLRIMAKRFPQTASASASSSRNRSSIPARRCSGTWKKASPRSRRCSSATTR